MKVQVSEMSRGLTVLFANSLLALTFSTSAHAQMDTLAGAKYDVADRFNVNVASGQVQMTQTTLSIGGQVGLSHTISSQTSDFVNYPLAGGGSPTVLGFGDANRGGLYSVTLLQEGPDPNNWQYGIRAFGDRHNVDFALTPNGQFVPYKLPNAATLVFQDDAEFTGHVLTTADGTRLYYPGNEILTLDGETFIRRSMSKIVRANGFTIDISAESRIDGSIFSVRTNTGFQLKYDFADSWTSSSPSKVTALNNRYETCPSDSTPCTPSGNWPTAIYTWPSGEPDAGDPQSLRVNSIFSVQDAGGKVTEYHHSVYESETGEYAPRIVTVTENGKVVMNYDYEWNSHVQNSSSNHSIIYTTGIASVASATIPGGGSQGYSMFIPRYMFGNYIGNINSGGTGPGRVSLVESSKYGSLVKIETWDQAVNFFYGNSYYPGTAIIQQENRVTSVNRKIGNITVSFEYDSRGNVTSRSENGIPRTAQYPASCNASNFRYCNKPEWIEDARGNRTYFTYHPESGQIASVTAPANNSGIQAKTVYQYDPYYAHYKVDSNVIETAETPVWLLTSETSCQNSSMNGANACTGNDEIVKTYEYDYHNLYLRGEAVTANNTQGASETRRTCYEYDDLGNRISETSPRANLASCL